MTKDLLGKVRDRSQARLDFSIFQDDSGLCQATIDFCLKQLGKAQMKGGSLHAEKAQGDQGRDSEQ